MRTALGNPRLRTLAVVAVLAAPWAAFFAPVLVKGHAPGAFDLSYQTSPWRDEALRPLQAQSPVQIDQAEQLPWVDGMWQSLSEGRIPMWTPAVGGGTSLGTNPVFTTYSVFTIVGELVGELVGGPTGLAVRVMLGFAVAEGFAFAFLRRLRLSPGAAAFGAVAYVYSGASLAFETRNAIPLLLPVMLWATDRIAEKVTGGRIAAVALAVLALWLEGFPAMLVHALAISASWWIVRTIGVRGGRLLRGEVLKGWLRGGVAFGASIGLGVMLSAFSAVPFALQLGYNDVFAARSDEASTLGSLSAWWLLDERGLGVPDRGPWYTSMNPFEGVAAVGTIVMFLAVIGIVAGALRRPEPVLSRRSGSSEPDLRDRTSVGMRDPGLADLPRLHWMVASAALVVAVYVGGPILQVLYALPGFSGNPFPRIRYVAVFGLCVLAAAGVDELLRLVRARSVLRDAHSSAHLAEQNDEAGRFDGGGRVPLPRARWPHLLVAVVCLAGIAAPFVDSADEYVDVLRQFRDTAEDAWTNEALLFGAGVLVLAVGLLLTRRLAGPDPSAVAPAWRSIGIGAVAAGFAFAQVGLQMTRFTPQVDRDFYYPETRGETALRQAAGDDSRFIGSGMGTFAPNTAMTAGLVDARSHSFRDPQWKQMILAAFPDALGPDPLKINVDFRGNVNWDAPVFDDMALGVIALSSSEVPLGDRNPVPTVVGWTQLGSDGAVVNEGPDGPFVGLDLMMRTSGDCAQGAVVVTVKSPSRQVDSRRPITDARAAGVAGVSLPFAVPLGDVGAGAATRVFVRLDGAPLDCVVSVGIAGGPNEDAGTWAAAPITRPDDAPWEMVSADGGWLYARPSAAPLVRLIDDWAPHRSRERALDAAVAPTRTKQDPMPIAFATEPPARPAPDDGGTVADWSADDHGISATVDATGDTMLVASFNAAPGWTVTVDGQAAKLVEPDGALLGVQLPEGRHEVRFEYFPPGLKAGALISVLGVLALTVVLVSPRIASRRRRRPDGPTDPGEPEEPEGGGSPGTSAAAAPD